MYLSNYKQNFRLPNLKIYLQGKKIFIPESFTIVIIGEMSDF